MFTQALSSFVAQGDPPLRSSNTSAFFHVPCAVAAFLKQPTFLHIALG